MLKRILAAAAALALTGVVLAAPHQGHAANSTQAVNGWGAFHTGMHTLFGNDYGAQPAPETYHYAFAASQARCGIAYHDKEIRYWDAHSERWLTKLVARPHRVCD